MSRDLRPYLSSYNICVAESIKIYLFIYFIYLFNWYKNLPWPIRTNKNYKDTSVNNFTFEKKLKRLKVVYNLICKLFKNCPKLTTWTWCQLKINHVDDYLACGHRRLILKASHRLVREIKYFGMFTYAISIFSTCENRR